MFNTKTNIFEVFNTKIQNLEKYCLACMPKSGLMKAVNALKQNTLIYYQQIIDR